MEPPYPTHFGVIGSEQRKARRAHDGANYTTYNWAASSNAARKVIVALVSVPKKVAGVTLGVLVRSMATAQTKRSEVVV